MAVILQITFSRYSQQCIGEKLLKVRLNAHFCSSKQLLSKPAVPTHTIVIAECPLHANMSQFQDHILVLHCLQAVLLEEDIYFWHLQAARFSCSLLGKTLTNTMSNSCCERKSHSSRRLPISSSALWWSISRFSSLQPSALIAGCFMFMACANDLTTVLKIAGQELCN